MSALVEILIYLAELVFGVSEHLPDRPNTGKAMTPKIDTYLRPRTKSPRPWYDLSTRGRRK